MRSNVDRTLFIASGDNIIDLGFIKRIIADSTGQLNIVDRGNVDIAAVHIIANEFNINRIISLDTGIIGIEVTTSFGPGYFIMLIDTPEASRILTFTFLDGLIT